MFLNNRHILENVDIEKRIAAIKDENERKVAEFLRKLGFEFIECNLKVGEYEHQLLGEIDLLYKFQDYLFLVEVSKEKKANEKRFAFFTKWVDKDVLQWITKQYQLQPKKIMRVYFEVYAKEPQDFVSPLLKNMTRKGTMNKVVYSDRLEIFENILQDNSQEARHEFLKDLGVSGQNSIKTILKIYFERS